MTSMLFQTNSNIIKEALWAFSNITASNSIYIESFAESNAFSRILYLSKSNNIDLRKESLWVICNAVTGADFQVRKLLFEKGQPELLP